MSLLNETLAIAYGEDKAKEMMKAKKRAHDFIHNCWVEQLSKEVVTSTSHRYLEDEKNTDS